MRLAGLLAVLAAAVSVASCDPTKLKRAEARENASFLASAGEATCASKRTPRTFVTSFILDMTGRQPNAEELAKADKSDFDHAKFVDDALASPRL